MTWADADRGPCPESTHGAHTTVPLAALPSPFPTERGLTVRASTPIIAPTGTYGPLSQQCRSLSEVSAQARPPPFPPTVRAPNTRLGKTGHSTRPKAPPQQYTLPPVVSPQPFH